MSMNPPKQCLRYFNEPLILSSNLISGCVRGQLVQQYGTIVRSDNIPAEYLEKFLKLITKHVYSVTQLCQVKEGGTVKYFMCVMLKPDLLNKNHQILSLSQLIQRGQFKDDAQLLTRVASQLLFLANKTHQFSVVHGAICPTNVFFDSERYNLMLGPPLGFARPYLKQFCSQEELDGCTPEELKTLGNAEQKITWQTDAYQVGYCVLCSAFQKILGFEEVQEILHKFQTGKDDNAAGALERLGILPEAKKEPTPLLLTD